MSKWELVKLGDVATYINGFAFKPEQWTDKGLPIIRIQNLNNENALFNYYDKSINEKYVIETGDVLVSWSASLGVFKWTRGKALLNQHIFKVVFDKIEVNKDFYIYSVGRLLSDMGRQAHGSTMKHITKGNFDNMLFPLPPLETQREIATTLDAASELLAMRKQQLAELDNLIKSTFYDMFGDPVTNEKGWEIKKLNELVSKLGDGLHGTPEYSDDGEYYFINGNNLSEGTISVSNSTKKVSADEYEKYKKELNSNTMFVSINGTLGNVSFYNDEKIVLGKSVCYFNVLDFVNMKYLYYILKSDYFLKYAVDSATGSTIKNVSLKSMREFPVLYPPLDLQDRFAQIVTKIEEQKALVKKAIDETQYLFDSLMSEYFE